MQISGLSLRENDRISLLRSRGISARPASGELRSALRLTYVLLDKEIWKSKVRKASRLVGYANRGVMKCAAVEIVESPEYFLGASTRIREFFESRKDVRR